MSTRQPFIFCTVGNDTHRFDRLVTLAQKISDNLGYPILFQSGRNQYPQLRPTNISMPFLERDDFVKALNEAYVVITHGGAGTLSKIVNRRVKCIVIPRLRKYDEHVNSHQIEIVEKFSRNAWVFCPDDCQSKLINANVCWDEFSKFEFKFNNKQNRNLLLIAKQQVDDWLKLKGIH